MTRIYFEKEGFKNFHRAYTEKKRLRKDFNINFNCKIIENLDGTCKLSITSINEVSQNLLKESGFKVVKVESL